MDVKCDKCGAGTFPKEITSKKTGKNYTVYECEGGCMNGKFRYSRFAPNDSYVPASSSSASSGGSGNMTAALRSIDAKLNLILSLLQKKSGSVGGGYDDAPPLEPEPDNEIPF